MVITVQDLFNVSKFNTKHDSKTCEGIPAKTVRLNAQEREFKAAPSQGKQRPPRGSSALPGEAAPFQGKQRPPRGSRKGSAKNIVIVML